MSKRKKNKYILPPSHMNVTRYPEDVWMKEYPESNHNEWYDRTLPWNIYDFLSNILIDCDENGIDANGVTMVTLDEDYYKYIKENNLENNQKTRCDYAKDNPYTKQQLFEKAKEKGLDKAYSLCSILIAKIFPYNIPKSTSYKLSEEHVEYLTKYLEKVYGNGNVYVYGNLMKPEKIVEDEDKIISNGNLYFEKGIRFEMKEYRKQYYEKDEQLTFLCIPFLIKSPVEKIDFTKEEFDKIFEDFKYTPDLLIKLSQEDFKEFGIKAQDFYNTRVYREIEKYLDEDGPSTISDYVSMNYEVMNDVAEFAEEIIETFGEE